MTNKKSKERNLGFSYCKGGCGKQVRLFGWPKTTFTYQTDNICRKCAKRLRIAGYIRHAERRMRNAD